MQGCNLFYQFFALHEFIRLVAYDIDSPHAEKRCGSKEVAIIGVDLGKAVLSGAGEVQGIGGPENGVTASGAQNGLQSTHHGLGQGQKPDQTRLPVPLELLLKPTDQLCRVAPLTALAEDNRVKLGSAVPGCCQSLSLPKQTLDRFVPRL